MHVLEISRNIKAANLRRPGKAEGRRVRVRVLAGAGHVVLAPASLCEAGWQAASGWVVKGLECWLPLAFVIQGVYIKKVLSYMLFRHS